MVRKRFSELDIMEMTEEEVDIYFYVDKLNKKYILKQLENVSAAKFKREDPKAYMLLTKTIVDIKYKYQVTFFYNDDPMSHKSSRSLEEAVRIIYDNIPSEIKFLTNIETI